MSRLIKLGLGIVVSIVLLFSVAVLVFILSFDANDHKDRIIAEIKENMGHDLAIEGNIAWQFYPWLGIEINRITLSNAQGFGDQPLFHADKIAIRIKTMSLFSQEYELDTLYFHGGKINLQRNKQGVNNWHNLVQDQEYEKDDQDKPQKRDPAKLSALILGGVDITDTQFTWSDQTTEQVIKISHVNISMGKLIFGEPININMSFQIESAKPDIKADLKMQGTAFYDRGKKIYSFKPLKAEAKLISDNIIAENTDASFSTNVTFNLQNNSILVNDLMLNVLGTLVQAQLEIINITNEPILEGQLSVSSDDLLILSKALQQAKLIDQLARFKERSFNFQTSLSSNINTGHIMIPDLQANLVGNRISGQFETNHLGSDTMTLAVKLQASGTNLPILLQVAGQFQAGASVLSIYGEKLSELPNKGFDIGIDFNADAGSGNIDISQLSIDALGLMVNGYLKATDINSNTGTIDGNLSVVTPGLSNTLAMLQQDTLAKTLQAVSADIKISGHKNDIRISPLQAQATILGNLKSPEKLTLKADAQINMAKQILTVNNINLNGLGLDLEANIRATEFKDNLAYSVNLSTATFDLRQFMQQMKIPMLVTSDPKVFKKVGIQTKLSGSTNHLNIDQFSLQIDDTKLQSHFSVKNFLQPIFNFDMTIDRINADRYLPPTPKTKKTEKGKSLEKDIALEDIRRFNSKGQIKIGELIYSKLLLQNIELGIDIKDGLAKLEPMTVHLYEGNHQGSIIFDARGKQAKVKLKNQLNAVQIKPMITDYTQLASKLSGVASINTNISTTGTNTAQFKKTLNGQATLTLQDIELQFIDIGAIVKQTKSLLKHDGSAGEDDKFQQVTATLNIDQGIIKNDDLLALANGFTVKGGINNKQVLLNINNNSIDYDLSLNLSETDSRLGVVINCNGFIDEIATACSPDYTTLINLIGKGLLERVEKLLPDNNPSETNSEQQDPPKPLEERLKDKVIKGVLDKLF